MKNVKYTNFFCFLTILPLLYSTFVVIIRFVMKKIIISLLILATLPVMAQVDNDHNFKVTKNLEVFTDVYRYLDMMYVDTLDADEVIGNGIDQMLRSLDPYTEYYPENKVKNFALENKISLVVKSFEDKNFRQFLNWCFLSLFVKIVLKLIFGVLTEERNAFVVGEFCDFFESEVVRRFEKQSLKSFDCTFSLGLFLSLILEVVCSNFGDVNGLQTRQIFLSVVLDFFVILFNEEA